MFSIFSKKTPLDYQDVVELAEELAEQIVISARRQAEGKYELFKDAFKDEKIQYSGEELDMLTLELYVFNLILVLRALYKNIRSRGDWSEKAGEKLFRKIYSDSMQHYRKVYILEKTDLGAEREVALMIEKEINDVSALPLSTGSVLIKNDSVVGIMLGNVLKIMKCGDNKDALMHAMLVRNALRDVNRRLEAYENVFDMMRKKMLPSS